MLRSLALRNIRGFVDVTIDLTPLTVFVGTNGSGKTTVLECIDILCQVARAKNFAAREQRALFSGRLAPEQVMTHGTRRAELALTAENGTTTLQIEGKNFRLQQRAAEPHPRSMILKLAPASLAEPSYLKDAEPALAVNGGGLASILDYMIGLRDGSIERVEEDLRAVVPQARRLRVVPEKIEVDEVIHLDRGEEHTIKQSHMGSRFELEFGKMGYVPASALSEGTLIVIGILTAIHLGSEPTIILLDDIDRGLHPTAQGNLIRAIRALVERRGDLQVVCTSHSSYALDAFNADEVHVTWVDEAGVAAHRKLSEHPEWTQWEAVMDPGEFWSTVGERWVGEAKVPT